METGVYRYSSSVSACDGPNIALRFLANDDADPATSCDGFTGDVNWQQLEAFWGAEKHRCQHESPAFESSTESQLENRDFLSEPPKLLDEQPARVGSIVALCSLLGSSASLRPQLHLCSPAA